MKKIRSRLSLVLLLILSFVVMIGATASMLVHADSTNYDEPAAASVYSDDWYEITINEDSLTILLDAEVVSYMSVSQDDLVNIKDAAVDAIRTIVIEQILNSGGTSQYYVAAPAAVNEVMPIDAFDDLLPMYARYKEYLTNRLSTLEPLGDGAYYAVELDKFLHGDYDVMIEYVASRYINDDAHASSEAELEDLIEKAHMEVLEVLKEVLKEFDAMEEDIYVSSGVITADYSDILNEASQKLENITRTVWKNDGKTGSFTIFDLLDIIDGVIVGDCEIYRNDKFVLSEILKLFNLPVYSDVGSWTEEQFRISYDVAIATTFGDVDFNLTVGLKGDVSMIKSVVENISKYVKVYVNGDFTALEVSVPEEFAALILKLSDSSSIPADVKHTVFGWFNKTGAQIFEDNSGYTYNQLIGYLRTKDFRRVFAGMLDAQKIRGFFNGFNVDLSQVTDANIDRLINGILQYAESIANNQNVVGIDEFLKQYGIAVSDMDGAVQKFLDLLNKVDYKNWDAATIREFLNDKECADERIDAILTRLADSATAENLYNTFVQYAELMFNSAADQLHNDTFMSFYSGNGELSWQGKIHFDLKTAVANVIDLLMPYAERAGIDGIEDYEEYINAMIDSYFEGETSYTVAVSLKLVLADIYSVEYIVKDEVIGRGLLPVGADVAFYANTTEVDGMKIIAWVDEEGNIYEKMPEKDVTLYALTEFEAYIAVDEEEVTEPIEKVYDGEPIVLTVEIIGVAGANPSYTWYKDGVKIDGAEGATLELVNVADSGTYYCVVESTETIFEFNVKTQEVVVCIERAPLDLEVTLEGWTYGEEANEPQITGNYGEGEITYLYEGENYSSDQPPVNAGTYTLTITADETDNYYGGTASCEFIIEQAELSVDVQPETNEYTGEAQAPDITVTGVNGEVLVEGTDYYVTYTNEDGDTVTEPIGIGVYTITITLKDTEAANNYKAIEDTYAYEITKIPLDLEVTIEGWTYGEEANEPQITGNLDNGEVTYLYEGEGWSSSEAPKNAGTYTLTITVAETENWSGGTASCEFTIEQAVLDLTDAIWYFDGEDVEGDYTVVFDGEVHNVSVVLPEGIIVLDEIEFNNTGVWSAVDAGKYIATFSAIIASGNYKIENNGVSIEWEITVAEIDLSDYDWSESEFTYSGETYSVALVNAEGEELDSLALSLAEGYELVYLGTTSATEAGEYEVSVAVVYNGEVTANYVITGLEVVHVWTIVPQTVEIVEPTFVVTHEEEEVDEYVYDGKAYVVSYSYEIDADLFNIEVGGDGLSKTNAGTYYVSIVISLKDSVNYSYAGETEFVFEWTIAKATVELTQVPYLTDSDDLVYDGEEHTVGVEYAADVEDIFELTTSGTLTATNAGTYYVTAVLELNDSDNYSYEGETVFYLEWTIAKAVVALTKAPQLINSDNLIYTGSAHTVNVDYAADPATAVELKTSGTLSATNAGTYYVTAVLELKDAINYSYAGETVFEFSWTIEKAEFNLANAEWTLDGEVNKNSTDFNGSQHTVALKLPEGVTLPDGITLAYDGVSKATDAGNYTVTLSIISDGNYEITEPDYIEVDWVIVPSTINLSGYSWSDVSREYDDGKDISIYLIDGDNKALNLEYPDLIDGYSLKYEGNTKSLVGTYVASIAVVGADGKVTGNYTIVGLPGEVQGWSIVKKTITIAEEDAVWSTQTEFDYDESQHEVTLTVKGEYADYVEVRYVNNKATDAGNYVAVAILNLKAAYDDNYTLNVAVFTISWQIIGETVDPVQPPVGNNTLVAEGGDLPEGVKVTVTASAELPEGAQLKVSLSTNEYEDEDFIPFVAPGTYPSIVRVYAISIDGIEGFEGTYTVTISDSQFAGKDLIVVHVPVNADGTPTEQDNWSDADASLAGKNLTFTTNGFSDFVVVQQIPDQQEQDNNGLWWLWLIIVLIILLIVIIILVICLLRREKEHDDNDYEPPVVIIKTVETPIEKVEETVEPVAEKDVEEESAAAVVEAEPEAESELEHVVVPEEVPDAVGDVVVLADGTRIIYDKSFSARLSQSDNTLKDYYTELKNYILSYDGVKSRISWHFDSFNKGRNKCLKLQFRGKSMYMYIALPAAELPEKYHAKDVSDKVRYEDVPTMLKIRKPRSLKYAKELVDMLMEKLGVEQGDIPNEKYKPRYRSTKSLIEMDLIKVKTTTSTFAAPAPKSDD